MAKKWIKEVSEDKKDGEDKPSKESDGMSKPKKKTDAKSKAKTSEENLTAMYGEKKK